MKSLSDETLSQVASFLKSIAGFTRIKILRSLHDGEKTVSEIIAEVKASQSNVSKHLATLTWAQIVTSRRDGTSIYYRIADPNVVQICDTVCRSIAEQIHKSKITLRNIKKRSFQAKENIIRKSS